MSLEEYQRVISALSQVNRNKAFKVAAIVLDSFASVSNNEANIWFGTYKPDLCNKIRKINTSLFGIAGRLVPPDQFDTASEVRNTLEVLYALKWIVENQPGDPCIALINSLNDKDDNVSSASSVTLFKKPDFLSTQAGECLFLGKTLTQMISSFNGPAKGMCKNNFYKYLILWFDDTIPVSMKSIALDIY